MKFKFITVLIFTAIGGLMLAIGGMLLAMNSPRGISEGRGVAMALMGGIVGGTIGLCVGLAREAMKSK
jgi:hypothetical protein